MKIRIKIFLLAVLQLFVFLNANSQIDIIKRKITVDSLRGRVDSLYLKGKISINNVDFYRLATRYNRDSVFKYVIDSAIINRQELSDTAIAIRNDIFIFNRDSVKQYNIDSSIVNRFELSDSAISIRNSIVTNPFNQNLNTYDTVRFYKQEIGNDKFFISADTIQGIVNISSLHEESNSVMNFYSAWDMWFDSENRTTINSGNDFFINSFYGNLSFQSNIAKINSSTIGKVEANPVLYLPDANSWSGTLETGLIRRNSSDIEFYNGSEWKSLTSGGTSDNVMTFVTRNFNDTISFDNDKVSYEPYTVTSDITIKKGITTEKYESTASAAFIGNGTNTLTFPADWRNIGDLTYDNTSDLTNYIIFYKQGNRVTYNIYDTLLADLSAPILDSAWQTDSSKIYLLFSENLNQDSVSVMPTSSISLTGATVSSFTGSNADTIIVNLTTNAVASAVSYTQPSSVKIQDISGNLTSNWTDSTIYNNIPTGSEQSFTINTNNNITKSGDDYTATAGTFNSYCLFNEFLSSSTDGYVIFDYNSTSDGTLIIGFDSNNTNKDYTTYDYAIYLAQSTGETRDITNGSLGSVIQNSSTGSKFKLERSGGTVTIEYASDGINFSTIYTFGGSSTGALYVNLNLNSINDDCRNLLNNF